MSPDDGVRYLKCSTNAEAEKILQQKDNTQIKPSQVNADVIEMNGDFEEPERQANYESAEDANTTINVTLQNEAQRGN